MNFRSTALGRAVSRPPGLHQTALLATLVLPLFLLYGRGIADALVSLVGVLFLAHSARAGDWSWARRPWVAVAAAFWLLQLLASVVTGPASSAVQAAVLVRLFVFAAALQAWVLTDADDRRALWAVTAILAAWVGLECWQQYLTGRNIMGDPRWGDGSLTGPFYKPRAGGVFLMLVFPGLMPIVVRLLQRRDLRATLAGLALLFLALTTMILIGQRMPNLLMVFGLCLTGLLVPRFRRPLLIALGVGAVALFALPVISPPTYDKLVLHFIAQMSNFMMSPYGQLFTRAVVMTGAHPWLGLGFDGFRDFCNNPAYFHTLFGTGLANTADGGADACNIHPHNYYTQVATMAGLPGLALFVALVVLWLKPAIASLRPSIEPEHAMLFVLNCLIFWPLASTSSLFGFDTAGWVFLTVGWLLAASDRRNGTG